MSGNSSAPVLSPQIMMRKSGLFDLPEVALPGGYHLIEHRPGMSADWDRIIGAAFGIEKPEGKFRNEIRCDPAYRPERLLYVVRGDRAVATAGAWYRPHYGRTMGYLHYVGVVPEEAGRGLGFQVSLACLHLMKREGRNEAVLHTDDYRVPAIKTYLKLGFIPLLVHENQRERWINIFLEIGRPDLAEEFRGILEGPLFSPIPVRADSDSPDNYRLLHKWHPNRPHRGGFRGGGDMDFLADESLYRPSLLGTASVEPEEVFAGSPMDTPLQLSYAAGPSGLPEGTCVYYVMRGQSPLGFWPIAGNPQSPGDMELTGPEGVRIEPFRLGFRIAKGNLSPGERVVLTARRPGELRWTPLSGVREFKMVVRFSEDEPEQRLPVPLVIWIKPLQPYRIEAILPATHRPGEDIRLQVTVRDEMDNRVSLDGMIGLSGGTDIRAPMVEGLVITRIHPAHPGVHTVRARLDEKNLEAVSNPSIPSERMQFFIGDLHCHDFLSEAEGYPDQVYRWAREDRALDFVSVVPQSHGWHDNETWTICKYMNERYLEEGRFVPFLGFEWQQTGYGDKVVHYLGGDQPYLPVDDGRYDSAAKLYEALRASDALVIGHHPAYPPGSWCSHTDFSVLESDVERLVELWSMHGSSEGYDPSDRPLVQRCAEGHVMDALRKGVRVGFVAGSDTHSARPGGSAKEPLPYWGGLCGVWAESLTRRGVFEALFARRTCALTGARMVLRMAVNGAPMGAEIPLSDRAEIRIDAWGTDRIAKVEILKNTKCVMTFRPGNEEFHELWEDRPEKPSFYHVRVTQEDGHLAVSSPVWLG